MMRLALRHAALGVAVVCGLVGRATWADDASPTTAKPTTRPAGATTKPASADQMLNAILKPTTAPTRELKPIPDPPVTDSLSGSGAVPPQAPAVNLVREGTFLPDRTGRLTRGSDGQTWEFTFEADGRALQDPPMIILPSLKLTQMEDAVRTNSRDLRFRVTGMVTEYHARNYLLIEKAVVIPDMNQQF